jgi:hypothetical protein
MSMSALILLQSLGCQEERVQPVLRAEEAAWSVEVRQRGVR